MNSSNSKRFVRCNSELVRCYLPIMSLNVGGGSSSSNIVVAIIARKCMDKKALVWALSHVVRPGDSVTLLAVFAGDEKKSMSFWCVLRRLGMNCGCSRLKEKLQEDSDLISESFSQMQEEAIKVKLSIKVIPATLLGGVAVESKGTVANWVVFDNHSLIKQQMQRCMEELHCNIAVIKKRSRAKILRLSLSGPNELEYAFSDEEDPSDRIKHSIPIISPDLGQRVPRPSKGVSFDAKSKFNMKYAGHIYQSFYKLKSSIHEMDLKDAADIAFGSEEEVDRTSSASIQSLLATSSNGRCNYKCARQ